MTMTIGQEEERSPVALAGFWARFGAFVIDAVVLGVLGFAMGLVAFDFLASLGVVARLFGLFIALAYFGILNSRVGGGQTLGKRVLDIKVVSKSGDTLSVPRSFARFLPLGLPWLLNGMWLSVEQVGSWLGVVSSLMIFGLGGSMVYLYLFNRRTRQVLHDLLVGSYVVRTPTEGPIDVGSTWQPHKVVCAFLIVAAGAGSLLAPRVVEVGPFPGLLAAHQQVAALDWVLHAELGVSGHSWRSEDADADRRPTFEVTAYSHDEDIENQERAAEVARLVLAANPAARDAAAVKVSLLYGYDMGIASNWRHYVVSGTPEDWEGTGSVP